MSLTSYNFVLLSCLLLHYEPGRLGTSAATVTGLITPRASVAGKKVRLECAYSIGSQGFYGVRWWKDSEQFYSFTPKNAPHQKVDHGLRGVNVVVSESDDRFVTLRDVSGATSGLFRCEVMGEAPKFVTSYAEANLTVVYAPEPPVLEGLSAEYRVGDSLNVTCVINKSHPPAQLAFVINGRTVNEESAVLRKYQPMVSPSSTGSFQYYNNRNHGMYNPRYNANQNYEDHFQYSSGYNRNYNYNSNPNTSGHSDADTPDLYISRLGLTLPLNPSHEPEVRISCRAWVDSFLQEEDAVVKVSQVQPFLSLFNSAAVRLFH
ncbi:uncharacterized protein LOC143040909 isoform X2 [Oratosquilla oratoria]|uniref:uncharacterized protein LOC143040909 isoform X2 n=1 Tax=Oratosquilla oratoria TaxID=337810 RepID=UPI003F764B2B